MSFTSSSTKGFEKWSYTAACIAEALRAKQPEGIPAAVHSEAIRLFESALRGRESKAQEDWKNLRIVSDIIALLKPMEIKTSDDLFDEIKRHLETLRNLTSAKTYELCEFMQKLAERGDEESYSEMMDRHSRPFERAY